MARPWLLTRWLPKAAAMGLEKLFSPVTINGLELKNRAVIDRKSVV
jgi:hypothetical protein